MSSFNCTRKDQLAKNCRQGSVNRSTAWRPHSR